MNTTLDPLTDVSFPNAVVDLARRCVVFDDGAHCELSETERSVLNQLLARRGEVVTRQQLLAELWGGSAAGAITRTVDMHVSALRKKLRLNGRNRRMILTLRGRGYMLARDLERGDV